LADDRGGEIEHFMTDTTDQTDRTPDSGDTAARVLEKLRTFVASLDTDERAIMAALLAPGVAHAYAEPEGEVVGFTMGAGWSPDRLPDSLTSQIRDKGLRVEFD
jgi:hypothetical protein